jgi:hypothetical protein
MRNPTPFVVPDITDEDIAWACHIMGLKESAFDKARRGVLLSQENIDVAACPGSGKTTLLVAKLAILARKWTDRRRGICVLSHTNAAREVIEERLGNTAEGQLLLSHPHYIGTIHGFVGRFTGIPWLKACGFPINVIDTEMTLSRRWLKLPPQTRSALEQACKGPGTLKIKTTDFSLGAIGWSGGTLGSQTPTYQNMMNACRQTAEVGCFCYEDPFFWGRELVDKDPKTINSLRNRFPILLIDEAQDNSELQSSILNRIFNGDDASVVCQRFGDANQAIYHSMNSKDAPTTWVFPDPAIKHDIPDSHRFGQTIANFAQPLGVEAQVLTGRGPDQRKVTADVDDQHTIFLFDSQATKHVLPAYASHLNTVFDSEALEKGSFVAVGAKHSEPKDDEHKPNSVCDYWAKYAPKLAIAEPHPKTFLGYIHAGRAKLEKDPMQNLHHMVEQIAIGLLEAVRLAGGKPTTRQRKNRYIQEMLEGNQDSLRDYTEFVRRFAVDAEDLTKQLWDGEWKDKLSVVVETLFEGEGECTIPEEFLNWSAIVLVDSDERKTETVYQKEDTLPKIRLGSIHSVKGETHTSVLVLETYIHSLNLNKIKKWLLGKPGTVKQRNAQSSRLKAHYVAMTRPTHLLCLALPDETFTAVDITLLVKRGWRIAKINATGVVSEVATERKAEKNDEQEQEKTDALKI